MGSKQDLFRGRNVHGAAGEEQSENPYAGSGGRTHHSATAEEHAFREMDFASSAGAQLDEFIARGRGVLEDLGQQRDVLKGTQRRLYGAMNTLGVSGDTIRMIERRAAQDKRIFYAGCLVFFGFCYLVVRVFR